MLLGMIICSSRLTYSLEVIRNFSPVKRCMIPVHLNDPTTINTLHTRISEVNKYAEFAVNQLAADTCINVLKTVEPSILINTRRIEWKLASEYFQEALQNYDVDNYVKGDENLRLGLCQGFVAVEDAADYLFEKNGRIHPMQEIMDELMNAIKDYEGSPVHYPNAQIRFCNFIAQYY
ncbi:MAG: hypothetical protein IJ730_04915 [Alphaproteobacteria bacterium]|nr:hypothetical protein [Alphaproteobacteria bacterium]